MHVHKEATASIETQHSYILMHTKKTIASSETHKLFINHTHGCTVLQTETFQQSCTAVPMTQPQKPQLVQLLLKTTVPTFPID